MTTEEKKIDYDTFQAQITEKTQELWDACFYKLNYGLTISVLGRLITHTLKEIKRLDRLSEDDFNQLKENLNKEIEKI
jgi:hypothetical protein